MPISVMAQNYIEETNDIVTINPIQKGITSDAYETIKKSISLNGIEIDLYVEFKDQRKALTEFEQEYYDILTKIQEEFKLDKISMQNWEEYRAALLNIGTQNDHRLIKINQFFDIFENSDQNDSIEKLASRLLQYNSGANSINNNSLLENIDLLTPYDSNKFSVELQGMTMLSSANMDIDDAVAYAIEYATSYNTPEYDKFINDCTNFASQILEAGGVSQEDYSPDETKGWWHTSENVLWMVNHDHSISWIRADTFAKYMGVGYKTKVHKNFSEHLQKGDFIAYDAASDGDWNHIGFVTEVGSEITNNGKTYTDYKVAQHTTNYHEWVSDSENGWEYLEDEGHTYGRVRR